MSNMITHSPKPSREYRVVEGVNPKDKTRTIPRPVVVNTETYDISRSLRFAMDNGYVGAGQFYANAANARCRTSQCLLRPDEGLFSSYL